MSKKPPTLRRHRRSGHGYAWLHGRQVWFGPYEDPETHRRFARTLAEWIANGQRLPPEQTREEMRVADIVAAYLEFAERVYTKPDGAPTREVENLGDAVRLLPNVRNHPFVRVRPAPAQDAARAADRKWTHQEDDQHRINRVMRLFSWAAGEELCRPDVYGSLRALRSLKRGRSAAN